MTGAGVRAQLNSLVANAEGGFEGYGEQHAWAQKSGLWRLSYMEDLLLPHNIDMMHSEKNVAELHCMDLFCTNLYGFVWT